MVGAQISLTAGRWIFALPITFLAMIAPMFPHLGTLSRGAGGMLAGAVDGGWPYRLGLILALGLAGMIAVRKPNFLAGTTPSPSTLNRNAAIMN